MLTNVRELLDVNINMVGVLLAILCSKNMAKWKFTRKKKMKCFLSKNRSEFIAFIHLLNPVIIYQNVAYEHCMNYYLGIYD